MKLFFLQVFNLSGCLFLVWFLSSCDGVEKAKGPVIQPKKEATWVRAEKVRTTKEEVLSGKKKSLSEVPINTSLAKRLVTEKSNLKVIIDEISCLDRLNLLDLRRTAIQENGGIWHIFERSLDLKPYSFNGMQLDSNINNIVFGIRHLCETSQGVPLSDLAIELNKLIEVNGRQKTKELLIAR